MMGQAPPDVPKRQEQDALPTALARLRGSYSDNLLELVQWSMELEARAIDRNRSLHCTRL